MIYLLREHPNNLAKQNKIPVVKIIDSRIQNAINYIEERFNQPISLAELSTVSALSSNRLIQLFRKEIDKTPFDYLYSYRVKKAIELLKDTDKTIDEIAIAVGFREPRNFYRKFKKYTKLSPTSFRNK